MCYPASHGDRRSCTCSPSCTGRSIWCGSPTGLWSVFSNNGCQREDLRLCRSQDFHGKAEIKKIRNFFSLVYILSYIFLLLQQEQHFCMCFCMPSSGNTQKWTIMQGYFQFVSLLLCNSDLSQTSQSMFPFFTLFCEWKTFYFFENFYSPTLLLFWFWFNWSLYSELWELYEKV